MLHYEVEFWQQRVSPPRLNPELNLLMESSQHGGLADWMRLANEGLVTSYKTKVSLAPLHMRKYAGDVGTRKEKGAGIQAVELTPIPGKNSAQRKDTSDTDHKTPTAPVFQQRAH